LYKSNFIDPEVLNSLVAAKGWAPPEATEMKIDVETFLEQWPNREAAAALHRVVFGGESLRDQRGCGVGEEALILCRDGLWEWMQ
jgi:hypothetical protein